MAKNVGLTVIATSRNAQKEQLLFTNGASYVLIDNKYLKEQVKAAFSQGVDKVLELIGTSTLSDSLACIKPGGTCCMSGMLAESWFISDFAPMEYIPATVHLNIYDNGQITSSPEAFQNFIHTVESGQIKLNVSQVFKLTDIVKAQQLMESNQAGGKIVVLT